MRQRLYLDTSVFGGHFDEEFAEFTIPLFERLNRGEFMLLFSSVTQDELEDAPKNVRDLVTGIKTENTEFIEATDEAVNLATITIADYLISWNFKHIVNVKRMIGYNSINIKNGYK